MGLDVKTKEIGQKINFFIFNFNLKKPKTQKRGSKLRTLSSTKHYTFKVI